MLNFVGAMSLQFRVASSISHSYSFLVCQVVSDLEELPIRFTHPADCTMSLVVCHHHFSRLLAGAEAIQGPHFCQVSRATHRDAVRFIAVDTRIRFLNRVREREREREREKKKRERETRERNESEEREDRREEKCNRGANYCVS